MNPESAQARIDELNNLISCVCRQYREVEELRNNLDREIMTLHKEKWSLERQITAVKICPPADKERRRRRDEAQRCATTEIPVDSMIALLDKMSIEQREALQRLVGQRLEDIDPETEANEEE